MILPHALRALTNKWKLFAGKKVTKMLMKLKTPFMMEVERKHKLPLERLLPETFNQLGLVGTAQKLEVPKSTVQNWMNRLGITVKRVTVRRGDTLEIRRVP